MLAVDEKPRLRQSLDNFALEERSRHALLAGLDRAPGAAPPRKLRADARCYRRAYAQFSTADSGDPWMTNRGHVTSTMAHTTGGVSIMKVLADSDWRIIQGVYLGQPRSAVPEQARAALEAFERVDGPDDRLVGVGTDFAGSLIREAPTPRATCLWEWRSRAVAPRAENADTTLSVADVRAAFCAAALAGDGSIGLLTLATGPVQSFIAAARSLRDLWTGSFLLSWLSFQAMQPVIKALGPMAFVFPSLRGNPLMDQALVAEDEFPPEHTHQTSSDAMMVPNLPHRSLAVVPWGAQGQTASDLARLCEEDAAKALREVADAVRNTIKSKKDHDFPDWDRLWEDQVKTMLRVEAVAAPLPENTEEWRRLNCDREYGDWAAGVDLVGRVLAARRSVRTMPVPVAPAQERAVPKCTLLGTWEQVGSKEFWEEAQNTLHMGGVRMRKGEAFCAPSLVKRFAFPAALSKKFELDRRFSRFPDTATVAAMGWLATAGLDWQSYAEQNWSGQWLHWTRPDQDSEEDPCPEEIWSAIQAAQKRLSQRPPAYFAILAADGDRMGDAMRRTRSPSGQARLSALIGMFAGADVRGIMKNHQASAIYAGGDDVLAVMPARQALPCAKALRDAFHERVGNTLSVGVAVVHHKADLRGALASARAAEKAAKSAGRDRLALTIQRRSGERTTSLLSWSDVIWGDQLVRAFEEGASDRWAYRLRQLAGPLDDMGLVEAMQAEIRRQIGRAEADTLDKLAAVSAGAAERGASEESRKVGAQQAIQGAFQVFQRERTKGRDGPMAGSVGLLRDFSILCQAASFLARARD